MFFSADGKFSSKKIEKFTDSREYGSNFIDGKWLTNVHHHKNDEDYGSKIDAISNDFSKFEDSLASLNSKGDIYQEIEDEMKFTTKQYKSLSDKYDETNKILQETEPKLLVKNPFEDNPSGTYHTPKYTFEHKGSENVNTIYQYILGFEIGSQIQTIVEVDFNAKLANDTTSSKSLGKVKFTLLSRMPTGQFTLGHTNGKLMINVINKSDYYKDNNFNFYLIKKGNLFYLLLGAQSTGTQKYTSMFKTRIMDAELSKVHIFDPNTEDCFAYHEGNMLNSESTDIQNIIKPNNINNFPSGYDFKLPPDFTLSINSNRGETDKDITCKYPSKEFGQNCTTLIVEEEANNLSVENRVYGYTGKRVT